MYEAARAGATAGDITSRLIDDVRVYGAARKNTGRPNMLSFMRRSFYTAHMDKHRLVCVFVAFLEARGRS